MPGAVKGPRLSLMIPPEVTQSGSEPRGSGQDGGNGVGATALTLLEQRNSPGEKLLPALVSVMLEPAEKLLVPGTVRGPVWVMAAAGGDGQVPGPRWEAARLVAIELVNWTLLALLLLSVMAPVKLLDRGKVMALAPALKLLVPGTVRAPVWVMALAAGGDDQVLAHGGSGQAGGDGIVQPDGVGAVAQRNGPGEAVAQGQGDGVGPGAETAGTRYAEGGRLGNWGGCLDSRGTAERGGGTREVHRRKVGIGGHARAVRIREGATEEVEILAGGAVADDDDWCGKDSSTASGFVSVFVGAMLPPNRSSTWCCR